jgi:hypothetical protein
MVRLGFARCIASLQQPVIDSPPIPLLTPPKPFAGRAYADKSARNRHNSNLLGATQPSPLMLYILFLIHSAVPSHLHMRLWSRTCLLRNVLSNIDALVTVHATTHTATKSVPMPRSGASEASSGRPPSTILFSPRP